MRYFINTLLIALLLVNSLSPALASAGRTDNSGCHTNRKTGEYHCHSKKKEVKKVARSSARSYARGQSNSTMSICSYNAYNCSDFSSQRNSQDIYEMCLAETGTDIHDLDRDNDGEACESLQ